MDIGTKIKSLRLAKHLTQEKLSQALNITPQAVSRWENGSALPDITLLPALSVCLGVRIDDFFQLTDEDQYDRINNMTEAEDFMTQEDFEYAQRFLKDRMAAQPDNARPPRSLAHLYLHRALSYQRKAEKLVKRSLELEPEVKESHSILSFVANGACWDWCSSNHRELIDYYYDFMEKNPTFARGYLWLLDNLIDDGRLDEAETVAHKMAQVEYTYHVPLYLGHIAFRRGRLEEAEAYWGRMVEENLGSKDEWIVWSTLGDARVKACRYPEALDCYHKAAELEQAPRYVDNWDSIAQIHELLGNWQEAAAAYEQELAIYREDWKETEGFYPDQIKQKILACKAKCL